MARAWRCTARLHRCRKHVDPNPTSSIRRRLLSWPAAAHPDAGAATVRVLKRRDRAFRLTSGVIRWQGSPNGALASLFRITRLIVASEPISRSHPLPSFLPLTTQAGPLVTISPLQGLHRLAVAGRPRLHQSRAASTAFLAARAMFNRANAVLGANWSLHDLRPYCGVSDGATRGCRLPMCIGCSATPICEQRLRNLLFLLFLGVLRVVSQRLDQKTATGGSW